MPSYVTNFKALISAYRWNGMTDKKAPVFVTYSFLKDGQVPSLGEYQPYANSGYSSFSAAQKKNFKKALKVFEKTTGIKFIQVNDPDDAMIKVMNTSGSSYGGWADYGSGIPTSSSNGYLVIDGSSNYAPGTSDFETILHELGHSSGLKHPFEGKVRLKTSVDNDDHTLMSYTSNGKNDTDLAHLDKDALHSLYGGGNAIKKGWTWNWSNSKHKFTLTGTNKKDKLIAVDAKSVIKGKGGADTIFGRDGDDILKGGAGKDKMGGGDGDDKILGEGGNDTFFLGNGDDLFNGGKGSDTVDFSPFSFDIWVDLSDTGPQATGYGNNTFLNIENAKGGKGDDRLTGNSKKNKLDGGKGADMLTGGANKDTFVYRNKYGKDTVTDLGTGDKVKVDDNNWSGNKSVQQVINQFGHVSGSDYVLKFDSKDWLTFTGASESDVQSSLMIV